MPSSALQNRRTHNLLLISKLLNQRESVSPFTLILDSLEQSSKPLLREVIRRANTAKTQVIFISFETLRKPHGVDLFFPAWREPFATVQKTVFSHMSTQQTNQRKLLLIDTLNPLTSTPSTAHNLPSILSSFFAPNVSLFAVYHSDVPLPPPAIIQGSNSVYAAQQNPYSPHPLTLLSFLATTIFHVHSFAHVLAKKAARERSVAEPVFGLDEGIEGLLIGADRDRHGDGGVVLEMEYRRKSGRGVREWFFLPDSGRAAAGAGKGPAKVAVSGRNASKETVILLADHPLYQKIDDPSQGATTATGEEGLDVTFELGLTERQRQDREGVVLPYFDAQKSGGGEGGRILYDMGVEDDFDEEEDEI